MEFLKDAEPSFAGSGPHPPEEADVLIWGVPGDLGAGTDRLGARGGPGAIRAASNIWNTVRSSSGYPLAEHAKIVDLGDVDLEGVGREGYHERVAAAAPPLDPDGLTVAIGGDHSITIPILGATGGGWGLIYLDAHPDSIDSFHGDGASHASTLRRLHDSGALDPRRTIVLGLRAPEAEEVRFLSETGIEAVSSWDIHTAGIEKVCQRALEVVGDGPVYLSIDMDVLDAACVPGVENPEPGGISSREMLYAADALGRRASACDLVEVTAERDPAGITAKTAARVLLDVIGSYVQGKGQP